MAHVGTFSPYKKTQNFDKNLQISISPYTNSSVLDGNGTAMICSIGHSAADLDEKAVFKAQIGIFVLLPCLS
jgi:hypothetical protein